MKIAIASDLHLEFGDINLQNTDNADVLILSGDICVARDVAREGERGDRVRDFFKRVSFQFPRVVYVMGNHEHYSGDYAKSHSIMQNLFDSHGLSNVHLLERSSVEIDGVLFLGGTLWTDYNKRDPLTLHAAETMMNDYRGVKNTADTNVWKFLPSHALADHSRTVGYIRSVLSNRRAEAKTGPVVVVGHHAPSLQSIHAKYAHQGMMNGCFASDLSEFILDHPEINLWTHGHMHDEFDYKIGETRVVCNPRGYIGYEARADGFEVLNIVI
jgi:Icc-related predicted phosphoesterase